MYRVLSVLIVTTAFVLAGNLTKTDIPCESTSDCESNNIPGDDVNAACVDNLCEFTVSAPEQMHVVTTLGAQCRFDEECNIQEAACTESLCTCANGTVASYNKKKCLKEAEYIGDDCYEGIQCNFPETTCRGNRCECEPGFGANGNRTICKELNGIGYSCNTEDDCEVEHTKCSNQTCECTEGFSAHQKECYQLSLTYLSKCDVDFQCQKTLGPDAVCIRNICHCQAKHIFSVLKNRCIHPVIHEVSSGASGIKDVLHLSSILIGVFGILTNFASC